MDDWFSECGQYGKIIDKKTTISHLELGHDNTCYGNLTILSQINKSYYWKFKINKQFQEGDISIGIDEYKCKWVNTCFYYQTSSINYSYNSNAKKYYSSIAKPYGINYKTDDIHFILKISPFLVVVSLTKYQFATEQKIKYPFVA